MWDITGPPFQQTQTPNSRHYQIRAISNDFDDWDWDEDRKHTFPENTGDPYGSNNAKTIMGEVYKELTRIDLTNFNCWPPGDDDDDDDDDDDSSGSICRCRVTKRLGPFTPESVRLYPNGPDEPPVYCQLWTEKWKQECFDVSNPDDDPGNSAKFTQLMAGLAEKQAAGDIEGLVSTRPNGTCYETTGGCCEAEHEPPPCCPDVVIQWWVCPPGVDPPG